MDAAYASQPISWALLLWLQLSLPVTATAQAQATATAQVQTTATQTAIAMLTAAPTITPTRRATSLPSPYCDYDNLVGQGLTDIGGLTAVENVGPYNQVGHTLDRHVYPSPTRIYNRVLEQAIDASTAFWSFPDAGYQVIDALNFQSFGINDWADDAVERSEYIVYGRRGSDLLRSNTVTVNLPTGSFEFEFANTVGYGFYLDLDSWTIEAMPDNYQLKSIRGTLSCWLTDNPHNPYFPFSVITMYPY
jgi:hypothetical protein